MNATAQAPMDATGRPAIQAGDLLTKRDGSRVQGPAMSFSAPFWVWDAGEAVKNHGNDKAAAFAHYDRLVHARRVALGTTKPVYVH